MNEALEVIAEYADLRVVEIDGRQYVEPAGLNLRLFFTGLTGTDVWCAGCLTCLGSLRGPIAARALGPALCEHVCSNPPKPHPWQVIA